MYLNDFSLVVSPGREEPGGYVKMQHNTPYTVKLRNNRNVRCDVRVEIDGKEVGTFRIAPHNSISLERPTNDKGRFTFYQLGTDEARDAELGNVPADKLGLVSAVFTPEKMPRPITPFDSGMTVRDDGSSTYMPVYPKGGRGSSAGTPIRRASLTASNYSQNMSSGGTGLSGRSNQQFVGVSALEYDYSQQTTINLRLVAENDKPRPLTQLSTPVPPPV